MAGQRTHAGTRTYLHTHALHLGVRGHPCTSRTSYAAHMPLPWDRAFRAGAAGSTTLASWVLPCRLQGDAPTSQALECRARATRKHAEVVVQGHSPGTGRRAGSSPPTPRRANCTQHSPSRLPTPGHAADGLPRPRGLRWQPVGSGTGGGRPPVRPAPGHHHLKGKVKASFPQVTRMSAPCPSLCFMTFNDFKNNFLKIRKARTFASSLF